MYKYLISLLIRLFISLQHLLSTHVCFMLCVKLVFVHPLILLLVISLIAWPRLPLCTGAYILMYKYLISLLIRLFISLQHLLSTNICFMLCVKLVFVLTLVWAPCISVVHYEIIVVYILCYLHSQQLSLGQAIKITRSNISIRTNTSFTHNIKHVWVDNRC